MARIVITTFGSGGDLNPFIALGLELKTRGHQVLFAVEDNFRGAVEDAGFEARHLTGNVDEALAPYAKEMYGSASPVASLKVIVNHYIVPTMRAKIEELKAVCEGVDLLVASIQQFAAFAASELTGIPLATVVLTPASLPSTYLEPQPLPVKLPDTLQRLSNKASWGLGLTIIRGIADKPVNTIRAEYGLPPRRNLMNGGNLSSRFTAVAVSPALVARPPDWPEFVKVTGFCFWDTPSGWQESAELTAFLDGSKPVVAVSSGSMGPGVPKAFDRIFQASIAAIRQLGARALVIGAAPGSLPDPLPQEVMALPFAPFSQIYPRCAAVINHGGIGTVGQTLRAGVPMLVVPWGADQFYNAAQVRRIGAGLWLARKAYNQEKAANLLEKLLKDPSYKEHSQALAAQIAKENGIATLAQAIEELLATRKPV